MGPDNPNAVLCLYKDKTREVDENILNNKKIIQSKKYLKCKKLGRYCSIRKDAKNSQHTVFFMQRCNDSLAIIRKNNVTNILAHLSKCKV